MKKLITALLILTAGISFAGYLMTGGGKVVTATATPQSVEVPNGDYVYTAMITVTGSERVYVLKNCSPSDFVLTNAIPVDAYPPILLSGEPIAKTISTTRKNKVITNLVVATESGTSEVLIKFE